MIWSTDDVASRWPLAPLASVSSKVGSGATPRGGKASYAASGTPLIRSQNVHFDGFRPEGVAFLSAAQAAKLDGARVEADDVLLNITGASIGRVCLAPASYAGARVNQHVCIIRPTEVRPEFLALYLASPQVQDAIVHGNYGATREALTKGQILELPVPIAPESEQDELVTKVREILRLRDGAMAHLDVVRRVVERIPGSALASAYREASSLEEGSPGRLAGLLGEPLRNGYSARPVQAETATKVLTLTATTSGFFDERQFKYTDETIPADAQCRLMPGDIVVQRGNTAEYVGVPALYEGAPGAFVYPDLMIRVRPRQDVDPRFVWYMLLAPQVREFVRSRATGSAGNMPKINQAILGDAPIPLPPVEVRARLVADVDAHRQRASRVADSVDAATEDLRRVFGSVLGKAFRGELV